MNRPDFLYPTDEAAPDAALRLLRAYQRLRGHYVNAQSLECELDEAMAGMALYTDEDKLPPAPQR